jgi:hypothetical protein
MSPSESKSVLLTMVLEFLYIVQIYSLPGVGLNHQLLYYESIVITTTPTAVQLDFNSPDVTSRQRILTHSHAIAQREQNRLVGISIKTTQL